MPAFREQDLRRLCGQTETLVRAQALLHTAAARTGPGSGYDLGAGAPALPAICAFLASQQLSNNDVTEKVAQAASCIAPKHFAAALATVRTVFAQSSSSFDTAQATSIPSIPRQRGKPKDVDYPSLVERHQIKMKETVVGWMEDAERGLDGSAAFRGRYDAQSVPVKCTVLYWICQVLEIKRVSADLIVREYNLSHDQIEEIAMLLDATCAALRARMRQEVEDLKSRSRAKGAAKVKGPRKSSSRKPRSLTGTESGTASDSGLSGAESDASLPPTPSSSSSSLVRSPSKSSIRRTDSLASTSTVPATPRRRVAFTKDAASSADLMLAELNDDDDGSSQDVNMTPTRPVVAKPRRSAFLFESEPESSEAEISSSETPRRSRSLHAATPSSKRTARTSSIDQATTPRALHRAPSAQTSPPPGAASEESEDDEGAIPQPRRRRPIFTDRKQWTASDPRAEREWAAAQRALKRYVAAHAHPFEELRVQALRVTSYPRESARTEDGMDVD